ncbi:Calcium binding protein [Echinococcus multilocularis]|uniref:Calcium binding protein n=1 Tax=Echinococcus multilocularis TaxID=6211 RepID=A0A068Y618_ECHMU|nr:Calcium binding protein [Echinococcus multilocularis]
MRVYTPEEKRSLLDKFHLMDTDNNGELSTAEILQCLKDSNLPKGKLESVTMTLSKAERQALLSKFYNMDTDRNGILSRSEIEKCLEDSNLPKSVAAEFLNLFDADGDGRVTLDEYERALGLKEIPETTINDWKQTFAQMDVDNSGFLTVSEIHDGLLQIGVNISKDDISDFIKTVDDNGDGVLTVDEFTALMRLNT